MVLQLAITTLSLCSLLQLLKALLELLKDALRFYFNYLEGFTTTTLSYSKVLLQSF
jgi:hypothetical protein